jgi:EmrB/QacA subfamily drug resistance transporter
VTTTAAPWGRFTLLALVEFLAVMDASVVNIALPTIGADLGLRRSGLAWVVDAYLVGFAGLLLFAGQLVDRFGPRRLFIVGVALFSAASVTCAAASTGEALIGGRVVQGLGAGLAMPAALVMIHAMFTQPESRNRAFGIFSGMAGLAAPIGLVLGGLLSDVGWPWIFLINVPVGVVVLVLAGRALPSVPGNAERRVDGRGAILWICGLSIALVGALGHDRAGWSRSLLLMIGLLLIGTWIAGRSRTANPLVPDVLIRPHVILGAMIFVLVGGVLFGTFFLITLHLQDVRGLSAVAASLHYLPVPIGMLAGTTIAPRLLRRGPRYSLGVGLMVQVAALGSWAVLLGADNHVVVALVMPATVWALGLGISIVSLFVICTTDVDPRVSGSASGLAMTAYQGGGALGLAVLVGTSEVVASISAEQGRIEAMLNGQRAALALSAAMMMLAFVLSRRLSLDPVEATHGRGISASGRGTRRRRHDATGSSP